MVEQLWTFCHRTGNQASVTNVLRLILGSETTMLYVVEKGEGPEGGYGKLGKEGYTLPWSNLRARGEFMQLPSSLLQLTYQQRLE